MHLSSLLSAAASLATAVSGLSAPFGPGGVEFALYPNTVLINNDAYTDFDPTIYKSMQPIFSNVSRRIGDFVIHQERNIQLYHSGDKFDTANFTLNHQGYFFAPLNDTYSVEFALVDDIAELWVGDTAYTTWTRTNEAMEAVYGDFGKAKFFTFQADEGSYTPIRVIYANSFYKVPSENRARFLFAIKDSQGNRLVPPANTTTPQYLRRSSGNNAPPFPPFGSIQT